MKIPTPAIAALLASAALAGCSGAAATVSSESEDEAFSTTRDPLPMREVARAECSAKGDSPVDIDAYYDDDSQIGVTIHDGAKRTDFLKMKRPPFELKAMLAKALPDQVSHFDFDQTVRLYGVMSETPDAKEGTFYVGRRDLVRRLGPKADAKNSDTALFKIDIEGGRTTVNRSACKKRIVAAPGEAATQRLVADAIPVGHFEGHGRTLAKICAIDVVKAGAGVEIRLSSKSGNAFQLRTTFSLADGFKATEAPIEGLEGQLLSVLAQKIDGKTQLDRMLVIDRMGDGQGARYRVTINTARDGGSTNFCDMKP